MSDVYYDTYNEGESPEEEPGRARKILKTVLRTVEIVLVLTVFFVLFYRMWEMREPKNIGKFLFTDKTAGLYEILPGQPCIKEPYSGKDYVYELESLTRVTLTHGGETVKDYETLTVPSAEYYDGQSFLVFEASTGSYVVTDSEGAETTVKVSGYYDVKGSPVEGALHVSHIYLFPAGEQVQLTFRYKNDSLEKLHGNTTKTGESFLLTLVDDKGNEYGSYSYRTDKKGVYRYVTAVFDGVDLTGVEKLDLSVGYLDEDFALQTLTLALYDGALPLPLSRATVKKAPPAALIPYVKEEKLL